MKRATLALSLLCLGSVAQATICSYRVFTPNFLKETVLVKLGDAGFGTELSSRVEEGTMVQSYRIVKDAAVTGLVELREAPKGLKRELTITDNRGVKVLRVVEEKVAVSRDELSIYSELDPKSTMPFLTIDNFYSGGVFHYVNGADAGITAFYIEFKERWKNVMPALTDLTIGKEFNFKSRLERFNFIARHRPTIAPYAKYFTTVERGKGYEITGRVPSNAVYHELLSIAWHELGVTPRMTLIIDSRLRVPTPVAPSCRDPR